jgi:predicted O-methyltransferase YrrM
VGQAIMNWRQLVRPVYRPARTAWRRIFEGYDQNELEIHLLPAVQSTFQAPDLSVLEQTVTGAHGVSGTSGHALFLFNLVLALQAQLVVEIGLGPGDSTSVFLLALKQTGGQLISIDIHEQPVAERKVDIVGERARWTFIHKPSEEAAKEWPPNRKIDILLIDGKHSYNQVKLEYKLYKPLMQKGGYVLFHDSETINGVRKFTQQLLRREGGVQFPQSNGLFVIRVGQP